MGISKVLEKLYVGDEPMDSDLGALKLHHITHILTLQDFPLSQSFSQSFQCKFVHILDFPDADLLAILDESLAFINEAMSTGVVLVHCLMGVSRSASVVLAFLMQHEKLSMDDALAFLKKKRPCVEPNSGFMIQLRIFETMGAKIDPMHPTYRTFHTKILAENLRFSGALNDRLIQDHLTRTMGSTSSSVPDPSSYKCRKCRCFLFTANDVTIHESSPTVDLPSFHNKTHRKKHKDSQSAAALGTETTSCRCSLFVQPLDWMANDITAVSGKLSCPKCHGKLGSFSWAGEKCRCGTWVTPAFHVHSSKVDHPTGLALPTVTTN